MHNSKPNAARVVEALRKFGAPVEHDKVTAETFTDKQVVYQIGVAPLRIDILTVVTGVRFPDVWRKRVAGNMFGVPVHFISLDDLVANKQALGRSSDLEDLKRTPGSSTTQEAVRRCRMPAHIGNFRMCGLKVVDLKSCKRVFEPDMNWSGHPPCAALQLQPSTVMFLLHQSQNKIEVVLLR